MGSENRDKVAVITGANAGLGLNLAERLVTVFPTIKLCLACRNKTKALEAASNISKLAPGAEISTVVLDTSSLESVRNAAKELMLKYGHIDYLYLNAGIMNVKGVDWSYFWQGIFSKRAFYMLATGEGLLMQEDGVTDDGLQKVFETNLFGHYVLVKELSDSLGASSGDSKTASQVIWTSSSNGIKENFSFDDFQCKNGKDPYSSSKYGMDITSIGLNNRLNKQGIYSHTVCPGLVMTNMTFGILPPWFWSLLMPIMWLLRIFVPSMTVSTANGTEALVWLSQQDPVKLDPMMKFQSECGPMGHARVGQKKMKIGPEDAEFLLKKFDELDIASRKAG